MSKLRNESSPGLDGLTAKITKLIANNNIHKFTSMVNNYVRMGSTKDGLFWLKILPKLEKTEYSTLKNFRPISLINTICKTADNALVIRMNSILDSPTFSILKLNVAYKSGMSVFDIISNLINNLKFAKKHNKDYLSYLIDFSAAFDSISHSYIFDTLSFIGFPDEFILQFITNFKNLRAMPKGYQEPGDIRHYAYLENITIPIESGVEQGSSKSGLLFVFLLAPLLILLENEKTITPIQITSQ